MQVGGCAGAERIASAEVDGRHMSKLDFRSLGIALIVVVILVVAIAASCSYHPVPGAP